MKTIIILCLLLSTIELSAQERPKSYADGGNMGVGSWTIANYQENAVKDSLFAVRVYKSDLERAEYSKPNEQPVENPKKRFKEQNDKLIAQQANYEREIQKATERYDGKISDLQKYRDEWVTYLKAEIIAKEKAKKDREINEEKKRIQDEIDSKIWQEKAEEKRKKEIEELQAMPSNPEYKIWKSKYEKTILVAEGNVNRCEAIIKKHTFKNAFGEKLYDSSDFTESEKKVFNQNLDLLEKHNDELGKLEDDKKFYNYWNDTVSIEKSTSSYRLSSYFNSKSKAY